MDIKSKSVMKIMSCACVGIVTCSITLAYHWKKEILIFKSVYKVIFAPCYMYFHPSSIINGFTLSWIPPDKIVF